MANSKDYPQQYDAETLADWLNNSNDLYLGGASEEVREAWYQSEEIRIKLHQKIFGENSPWNIRFDKNRKANVYWDKHKAKRLNLIS